jgi:hypothetical protein
MGTQVHILARAELGNKCKLNLTLDNGRAQEKMDAISYLGGALTRQNFALI